MNVLGEGSLRCVTAATPAMRHRYHSRSRASWLCPMPGTARRKEEGNLLWTPVHLQQQLLIKESHLSPGTHNSTEFLLKHQHKDSARELKFYFNQRLPEEPGKSPSCSTWVSKTSPLPPRPWLLRGLRRVSHSLGWTTAPRRAGTHRPDLPALPQRAWGSSSGRAYGPTLCDGRRRFALPR